MAAAGAYGDVGPGSFSFPLGASCQVGGVWLVSSLRVNSEHSIRVACARFLHCEVTIFICNHCLGGRGRWTL